MDLRLFGRVIWRFRLIIAAAFVVAIALAVLSAYQVSVSNGLVLKARKATFYKADATLLVTEPGFPWGYADQPYRVIGKATTPVLHGDQARLTNLAQLFAEYANSDAVAATLKRNGLKGKIDAEPVTTNLNVGRADPAADRHRRHRSREAGRAERGRGRDRSADRQRRAADERGEDPAR